MLAWRQWEHGETLSQRTLRRRQTTQLRSFGLGAAETGPECGGGGGCGCAVVGVACFSEAEAEPPASESGGLLGDRELMMSYSSTVPKLGDLTVLIVKHLAS